MWFDGDKKYKVKDVMLLSHSAKGNILPCCWCFNPGSDQHFKDMGMYDDDIKIQNVKRVEEILLSKQWINFHKTLLTDVENAPPVCKDNCWQKTDSFIVEENDQ